MDNWYLYVAECCDGTLYCGISTNVEKRIEIHNKGAGAKYTMSRTPIRLIYKEHVGTRSQALKKEYKFKKLKRRKKLEYINDKDN